MITPSKARVLVSNLQPFNPGHPNWRVIYNSRRDVYLPEASSLVEIVGALNFANAVDALQAITCLELPGFSSLEHPLKRHFEYNVDAYEYDLEENNYAICKNYYTGEYEVCFHVGIMPIGAFHFPKHLAIEYTAKLNSKEIIL